jgi:ABC-type uncharacterized transport system substrate-binding protein
MAAASSYKGKKILHIDSYHPSYAWSDDIRKGVATALNGTGVELRTEEMDSKRHPEEDAKKAAGLRIKSVIEEFKPDVVIATDDNASKYVIQPYFKNAKIPVVFSGVNWDASKYGYPYKNATGMEEVDMVAEMYSMLKKYAKGPGVGLMEGDDESSRANCETHNKRFFHGKAEVAYVKDFSDFKTQFLALQKKVGIIFLGSFGSVKNWEPKAVEEFLYKNTVIPTGSHDTFTTRFVSVTYAKYGEEQGEWAAQTALKILNGASPSSIPIVHNKRVKLFINQKMAKKVGLNFPDGMLKMATVIDD